MYLKKCKAILEANFPLNWQNEYIPNDKLVKIEELIPKFISSSNEIFHQLNISILTGECIFNENFEKDLDDLSNYFDKIYIDKQGVEDVDKLNDDILKQFVNPIRFVLKYYFKLIHLKTKRKLASSEKNVILLKETESIQIGYILTLDLAKELYFLEINIQLYLLDIELEVSKEITRRLSQICDTLTRRFKSQKLMPILLEKAHFFLKKIYNRLNKNSEDHIFEINFESIEIPEILPTFSSWIDYSNLHYHDRERDTFTFRQRVEDILNSPIKNLKAFHLLAKHYKDGNTSDDVRARSNRLKKLTSDYCETLKLVKSQKDGLLIDQFNYRAYIVNLFYFKNNRFSLISSNNNLLKNKLEKNYEKLKELRVDSTINNYFIDLKMAEYQLQSLELSFNKDEKNFDDIHESLERLNITLVTLEENFEWCRKRCFLPFQMPFPLCQINYDLEEGETINLFVFSSFVLPTDYKDVEKKIVNLKKDYEKFKLLFSFHENIKEEKSIIKRNRETIEKHEKKNIEILSVFAAIVLFTVNEIQIFKNFNETNSLKFTLLFAYCLSIFAMLIWMITRDYSIDQVKIPNTHIVLISILVLSTLGIFAMIYNS